MESYKMGQTSLVFIGGGKMGEAIALGLQSSQAEIARDISSANITIVDPGESRRTYLEEQHGMNCLASADSIDKADIVILAVKPQVIIDVVQNLKGLKAFSHSLFVSIAAGVETKTLIGHLPEQSRLVRVMPNLPLSVGEGASVVCPSATSTENDVDIVHKLFACLGVAERVEEDLVDVATALSGSGPAYVAAMMEILIEAGEDEGLSKVLAQSLVLQTVYGTCVQLKETNQDISLFKESVCSPGGSTLAALQAMNDAGMHSVYKNGVVAAVRRAKELGRDTV